MIMFRIHPTEDNRSSSSCQDLWTRPHSSSINITTTTATSSSISINVVQEDGVERRHPSVLTVWTRSSMSFQGTDGFTVFDHHGRLVFRVDNYTRKTRLPSCAATSVLGASGGGGGGLILMDGSGKSLISLKPQVFSMQHQWNGYRAGKGDDRGGRKSSSTMTTTTTPNSKCSKVFAMRRSISSSVLLLTHQKKKYPCEAEVFMKTGTGPLPDFRIEGSFRKRNCKIKKLSTGELAAKIVRKRVTTANLNTTILLSDDVFSLVVQPGFDPELIMAFVVILDRICGGGSGKPFAPLLCS